MKEANLTFPRVKTVKHLGGHKLAVGFTDGKKGVVDFRRYVVGKGGLLKRLEDPEFFAQVRIDPDFKTLVWPNDADWCPDVLYWLVTGKSIPWATEAKYHKPPPHLRKKKPRGRPSRVA